MDGSAVVDEGIVEPTAVFIDAAIHMEFSSVLCIIEDGRSANIDRHFEALRRVLIRDGADLRA